MEHYDHYAAFEKELTRRRAATKNPQSIYKILEKISIETAIERIKSKQITSKRFSTVLKLGECCKGCGVKRSYVAQGRDNGGSLHWDLYAENGVMLTIDHILPKSRGGKDHFDNYQLMCTTCNRGKDNVLDKSQVKELVAEISNQGYIMTEYFEKLIKESIKEIFYRKESFSPVSAELYKELELHTFSVEALECIYLHLRVDDAKMIRKFNSNTVNAFLEFNDRLIEMQSEPKLQSFIDYDMGKVYIIKPIDYNFFDENVRKKKVTLIGTLLHKFAELF